MNRYSKLKMLPRNVKVNAGLRLFGAGIALIMGQWAMLLLILFAPIAIPMTFALGITPEEKAKAEKEALMKEITDQVQGILKDSMKEGVKKSDLDARINEVNETIKKLDNAGMAELKEKVDKMAKENEALVSQLKEATDALKKQGEELNKIKENGVDTQPKAKSFREVLKDAFMAAAKKTTGFMVEKNDDNGKRMSLKNYFENGNRTSPVIDLKAAVDMLESNIVQSSVQQLRLTTLDPARVGIPLAVYPHVWDIMMRKTITRPYMALLVVYDYQDGADTKTEGAASTKSSFLFKTVDFKSFYIATHFVLSDETLDDLEEALDEIAAVAPDKIHEKIDSKILSASGDDSTDIKGLLHSDKRTAFSHGVVTTVIDAPSIIDVIGAAKLQCTNNKYRPDIVLLDPEEVYKIGALKNTQEDSKFDRRVQYDALGNPVAVCGLRIIQNTQMNSDEFVVMDHSQAWIGVRREMTLEIGNNGTDLTEGQKTVVIKVRLAFGVRDKAAVIYCDDVTQAIAGLGS